MITKIKDKEGKEIYGREEIIETIIKFYKDLYMEFKNWDGGNRPGIKEKKDEEEGNNQEEFLSIMKREVENATEKAKENKAPGMDGIQNEIIKIFKE